MCKMSINNYTAMKNRINQLKSVFSNVNIKYGREVIIV